MPLSLKEGTSRPGPCGLQPTCRGQGDSHLPPPGWRSWWCYGKIGLTPPLEHRSGRLSLVQAPTESQGPCTSLPGPLGSAAWAHRRRIRKGHGNSNCHGPRSLLSRQSQRLRIPCVRVCVHSCVRLVPGWGGGRHRQEQFTRLGAGRRV